MGAPVQIKNAADAFTNQNKPTVSFPNKARLYVRNTAGSHKRGWLFFNKPWPYGANIVSAKLRLWNGDNFGSSVTASVQRPDAKWKINKINHNNQPGVTGSIAQVTKASASPNTMWEFDVTTIIEEVANGGAWYGFRLTTNSASDHWFHSAQAEKGSYRPVLIVEWTDAPDQPDNLQPSGTIVSSAKPVLTWDFHDTHGDVSMSAFQVQIDDNSDLTSPLFDSGEVASSVPEYDLSGTAYVGVGIGSTHYWRVRNKDGAGLWSSYSDISSFGRAAKGTLTMTSPTGGQLFDWTPEVAWTFSGQTQRAYQIAVAPSSDPNDWLWDSGKITSTDTSVGIPQGVLTDGSMSYRVILRVWDTIDRVATPNDPIYVEAWADVVFAYDNTIVAGSDMVATSDAILPIEHLTWTRATTPDSWVIQRSGDGGATWQYIGEAQGADLSTGGTNYAYDDPSASPYKAYTWRVLAIVGGRQSGNNPTATGQIRRLAPFLMREDGTDAVCFLNPKRSRERLDIQEFHEVMDGPPVVVTQRLGGFAGHVEGRFIDDALAGVTADEMLARFERMRLDAGITLICVTANETRRVVAYNFEYDVMTDTRGVTYLASFDWIEVP